MSDFEELSFVIPGYTPETMPLDRLIDYLQQFAIILGDVKDLHLIEIRQGSCEPAFHIPKASALEAKERAGRVRRGDGTKRQIDAFRRVSRMVRRDALQTDVSALLRSSSNIVLEIPAAPEDSGVLAGIRQASTVDGQLISVGGSNEDANLRVQDLDGRIMSGFTAKRSLAKELAGLMWEPVRLFGTGIWERSDEGEWSLDRMQVQSFERLDDERLGVTMERLRSLNVAWPADAFDRLRRDREDTL